VSKREGAFARCVGIDVSAKTLAVAQRGRGGRVQVREEPNTQAGHRALCRLLRGRPTRVCLEATGIYHLDLTLALRSTPGIDVMVANPRAVHGFAGALMTRGKTDASDAEVIPAYAERMPWQPWRAPSAACFELRTLCRHTVSLRERLASEKARIARAEATASISSWVREDIAEGIEQLRNRIAKLEAAAVQLATSDPELSARLRLMRTVPGIADVSGLQLLSELCVLPSDMTAKQWVAHAGPDPRRRQSGTSLNKPSRISKAGNRYVRRALYMPALVAIRHDPNVAALFNDLVDRGKARMQAVAAVMRKLLQALWGMLKSDTEWDGSRFRALPPPVVQPSGEQSWCSDPPAERRPPFTHASSESSRAVAGKGAGQASPVQNDMPGQGPACISPLPAVSTVAR